MVDGEKINKNLPVFLFEIELDTNSSRFKLQKLPQPKRGMIANRSKAVVVVYSLGVVFKNFGFTINMAQAQF